jgi:hypothetical protein
VKRFLSEAEQDYRNAPEVSASIPASDPPDKIAISSRWSLFQGVSHAAQNAGAAMGNFARVSYRCLRSLFGNCRRTAQE